MSKNHRTFTCPDCGEVEGLVLKKAAWGYFYGCKNYPSCKGLLSAHQDSANDYPPMGEPADANTRKLRRIVHSLFDTWWPMLPGQRHGKRSGAYRQMAKALDIPVEKCHVSLFDAELCERAIKWLEAK